MNRDTSSFAKIMSSNSVQFRGPGISTGLAR